MSAAPQAENTVYQPPSWEAILAAHARIAPRIHRTPVLTSSSLDSITGAKLFFKCENLQRTGSFKIRGATNAIFSLSNEEAARGIVTPSSGNHGAAVACAAAWRGVPAYIVVPKNAPKVKVRAIEAYGGKVTFSEPTIRSRTEVAARVEAETGAHLVHPYDDDRIIAGQATAAKELLEEVGDVDAVWVYTDPMHPGDNRMEFDNYRVTLESAVRPTLQSISATNRQFRLRVFGENGVRYAVCAVPVDGKRSARGEASTHRQRSTVLQSASTKSDSAEIAGNQSAKLEGPKACHVIARAEGPSSTPTKSQAL